MSEIHPSSVVDAGAELGDGVKIGPFCHVGAGVSLGDGVELVGHASIMGNTHIGEGSKVFPFASLGGVTQILDQSKPVGQLIVGANNTIREYVTMQPGQLDDPAETRIGDNNLFMVGTHIAHDCRVGNNNVFANHATLAGHVTVGNFANIGGLSAVHQFCHIGDYAFIGGHSMVAGNVIPFGMVYGDRANLEGLNIVGMKRRGFARNDIHAARNLFSDLFRDQAGVEFNDRLAAARAKYKDDQVALLILDFVNNANDRGFCQGE
jgi:UDP-N-acetylglucosamine acyltransferase